MAVQLVLVDKTTRQPVDLVKLDELICQHLGVEPDPVNWVEYWMDTVGFAMALGSTRDKIVGYMNDEVLLKIWDFVAERYENNSHYTR